MIIDLLQLCGVSIMRAGEVLEPALMSVSKDVTLGKILIQTNEGTGEPEVLFYFSIMASFIPRLLPAF